MAIPRDKKAQARDAEYAAALDMLDRLRDDRTITANEHLIRHSRLLAEATRVPWPDSVRLLVGFATVAVVVILFALVMQLLAAVVNAFGG